MTKQELRVCWVLLLLIFGGLVSKAWWRSRSPASLPPVPVSADPGTQYEVGR